MTEGMFAVDKLLEEIELPHLKGKFKKTSIYKTISEADKEAFINKKSHLYAKNKYKNAVLYWAAPEYAAFIESGEDWKSIKDKAIKDKQQGYIYLVKMSNTLYKYGRTNNMRKRMNGYPRGSELIKYDWVYNMVEAERILLNCAEESNGKHDIGNEYYKFDDEDEPLKVYNLALKRIPV